MFWWIFIFFSPWRLTRHGIIPKGDWLAGVPRGDRLAMVSYPREIDLLGYPWEIDLPWYHTPGRLTCWGTPGRLTCQGIIPGGDWQIRITRQIPNQNQKYFNPLVSGPGRLNKKKNWMLKISLDCTFKRDSKRSLAPRGFSKPNQNHVVYVLIAIQRGLLPHVDCLNKTKITCNGLTWVFQTKPNRKIQIFVCPTKHVITWFF